MREYRCLKRILRMHIMPCCYDQVVTWVGYSWMLQDWGRTMSTSGRGMTVASATAFHQPCPSPKTADKGANISAPKSTPAVKTIRCHLSTNFNAPESTPLSLTLTVTMTTDYFLTRRQSGLSDAVDSPISPASSQARSNPLTTKVTSVLSASYADSDIRDALNLLDKRGVQNSSETRRQLRLDVQKEVIESNGDIIREFGHVAEV